MIRIFLFALLVTCFLLRCKQESHSLKVPFLSSANIKVDGKLNEGGWSEAGKIDRLTEFFLQEESHDQTEVYLLYDSVHLYIGAKIYNGYIEGSLKERDSEIYKEHCFEFFLDLPVFQYCLLN